MVHTRAFWCWDRRVVYRCLEGEFGLSGLTGRDRNVDRSRQVEDEAPALVGLWDDCEAGDLGVGRKVLNFDLLPTDLFATAISSCFQ